MADATQPTQVVQQQVGFAPEIAPYAQDLIGRAAAAMDLPYQAYTGEQVAQFSPLQQKSYDYAGQLTSAPQLQDATALAGLAGLGGLNTQYTFKPYTSGSITDAGAAQQYMSPYMQNVVDVQQQQAKRQADIAAQTLGAQAAQRGAFGGGRDAIQRAQAAAELQRNLQGIQASGLQNAYQQAQQQFNQEQQQRQAAANLNAQQQQFGASLGMQGLQTALSGANTLGNLGQTQFAQNVGIIGLQNQLGLQQQQQAQNILNAQYQNFLNQQNYPYKQMGFLSDIIRGVPLTQTGSSVYQAPPTMLQSLTSLGLGAYGLGSLFGGSSGGKAEGGMVNSYADGGSVLSQYNKDQIVKGLHPNALPRAIQGAMARGDIGTAQTAQEEMSVDAAIRRGIAAAAPYDMDKGFASGGIVAFADGDWVQSDDSDMMISREDAGLDSTETNDGSPGNAGLQQRYTQRLMGVIDRMEADKGHVPLTAQERRLAENIAYQDLIKTLGPDIYAPMRKSLQEQETGRTRALEEGKGLAALKAAAAVLSPGGTMRGLGAAGSAFAESYGQALSADKAEKRNIAQMQFNLADAERKERLGLTKEARALVQNAEAAGQAAAKNRREINTAIANALGRGVQATRPAAVRAPGSGPKANESIWALEQKFAIMDPSDPQYEATKKLVEAGRAHIARTKTSDVGPERGGNLAGRLSADITEDATKAWSTMSRREKRDWAKANDIPLEDAREEFLKDYQKRATPAPRPAPAAPATPTPSAKPATPAAAGKTPSVSGMPEGAKVTNVKTNKGYEVRDATGKLIGYAQ